MPFSLSCHASALVLYEWGIRSTEAEVLRYTFSYTDASQFANDIRGTIPRFQAENFSKNQRLVLEFSKLAEKKGCTPGQLAIAWVTAQGAIPIPGTKSPGRVEENTGSRDVDLTEDELKEIRTLIDEAKPEGARYSEHHMRLVGK